MMADDGRRMADDGLADLVDTCWRVHGNMATYKIRCTTHNTQHIQHDAMATHTPAAVLLALRRESGLAATRAVGSAVGSVGEDAHTDQPKADLGLPRVLGQVAGLLVGRSVGLERLGADLHVHHTGLGEGIGLVAEHEVFGPRRPRGLRIWLELDHAVVIDDVLREPVQRLVRQPVHLERIPKR